MKDYNLYLSAPKEPISYEPAELAKAEPPPRFLMWLLSQRHICTQFSFILRNRMNERKEPCLSILRSMRPFLTGLKLTNEWPVTGVIYDGGPPNTHALLCSFENTPQVSEILTEYLHLSKWINWWDGRDLDYPEDLCFARKDGYPVFASVTHEGVFYLYLRSKEGEVLKNCKSGVYPFVKSERVWRLPRLAYLDRDFDNYKKYPVANGWL